jgi:hypothetical protein
MLVSSAALKGEAKHASMHDNADEKAVLQAAQTEFMEEERKVKAAVRGSTDIKEAALLPIISEGMLGAFPWKQLLPPDVVARADDPSVAEFAQVLKRKVFDMSVNEVWCQAER